MDKEEAVREVAERSTTRLLEAGGTIILPERMDLGVAIVLRETILERARDLEFDARGVRQILTPALQVMMAARDHQASNGRSLRILSPSAGLAAALRTLGVSLDRLQTAEASA